MSRDIERRSARFKTWKRPKIRHGKLTKWLWAVWYPENLKLGRFTDIGAFTFIDAKNGVTIGDHVQVGGGCQIYTHDTEGGKDGPVVLEENCKIGANSTIMPGVTVGRNSRVGAHSLVKTSIPPHSLAYGVPARVIGDI